MNTVTANTLFISMQGKVAQYPKSDDLFTHNANVVRVMRIVPDKQDCSYVEKVQLPENDVLSLCNKLVPTSASVYLGDPPRTHINFKALNGLCLSTVGIYGDKKMMIQIFLKQCLIGDSVLAQMDGGLFEPGLYVIVPEEAARTVVAFYWHEGEHFKEASRKDVSCNFIRYLVELCQCVYICVEGSYNFGALTGAASRKPSNSGRTMKIEVKKVMNSKDDVKLMPGFHVGIAGQVKVGPVMFLPFFCEGYRRCCFLTEEYRAPRTCSRTEDVSMKASELGNVLDKWSWESSVDYSRMSNQDFINLLQYCHPGEYQNYCKWKAYFMAGSEKRFKQGEDSFLLESKRKMSKDRKQGLVTTYIEKVCVKRQSSPWSHNEALELNVKVSIVKEEKMAIVWKACELTPMKKDLNELNSNSDHPIVPTCGRSYELVAIDPEHERLFKVVSLNSGELMVFIHNFIDSCLYLYRCPEIGLNINDTAHPIYKFRRGFDLLAVDESTRSMALYEKDKCKIVIYKFDESFRKVYWTGVEVHLETFEGSNIITWMHLIPEKMELLLVDDTNRVRVVEIHAKPTMRAKQISISGSQPFSKACISADGYFLIIFKQVQSSRYLPVHHIQLEIFVLGDRMSFLKTIHLSANSSINMSDLEQLEVNITNFESQSHLVLYSHADAPTFLSSHILKTTLAGEVTKLQHVQNKGREMEETEIDRSCSYLAYIYHIFDKFGTSPALFPEDKRSITFKVLLSNNTEPCNGDEDACIKYLQALLLKLRTEKAKDFSNIKIEFQAESLKKWETESACLDSVPAGDEIKMKMGMWVRKLICLVPLQIARAENNGMVALKDGFQIPHDINYVDSVSLANSLRFGFYDAVLNSWKGKIKVISSMGKQSSGKSFLLNHLSGSLLDVSGGRCTDGVWMTIATTEDQEGGRCLYVLLDFEGLGSFERSEQEDMLLSVLNAAVSNLTIFNKKDFHFDKDTKSTFKRFQGGVNLIKQDRKLFKGQFYIAIKDVDGSDIEELMREFNEKISQICNKSQENFFLKMYDGNVEIATMAPYNRSDYYRESLIELADTVKKMDSLYDNGYIFLKDFKLLIAQIAGKDWTSIKSKRVALVVDILRRNLMVAVNMGCLSFANTNDVQGLVNFDTQEEIPDLPVVVWDLSCGVKDEGLCLAPSDESSISIRNRNVLIRLALETLIPREGNSGELWLSVFQNFLQALGDRRQDRVRRWISSNTVEFCDNEDVKRLQLEASVALAKVKQGLSVCGCKCCRCFYRCVFEKGHDDDHSCMGDHLCAESCSYCGREGYNSSLCSDVAGHEGSHDCKERSHTCGVICHLFEMSSNCNKVCSLGPEHPGKHKCNSPHHICNKTCSLPSCDNPCAVSIDLNHEKHQCHETYCQRKCSINGCSRTCGVKNHFHDLNPYAEHLCGNEHACPEECGMPGICEILTELVRQPRIFDGQRGSFVYDVKSEQNGLRKSCCKPIPPFERNHQGPHVHTEKVDSVHYCDTRCQACDYFCQLEIGHFGLHDTVHGNMRNVRFTSEEEDIDIEGRKYKWGERGDAEMCNMYCSKQGRGHVHLVPCPGSMRCTGNLYDGSRHETVRYGPDVNIAKDEMTHETFWQYVRFVDPCTEEEREEIGLCNHYCKHEEHEDTQASDKSYCTQKLWHSPLTSSGQNQNSAGYITDDGHHFVCRHYENVPYHVIFVIDKSSSMGNSDITPTMAKFRHSHNCRLGCIYEAILNFIQIRLKTVSGDSISVVLFDKSAIEPVMIQDMEEIVVDSLLQFNAAEFIHMGPAIEVISNLAAIGVSAASVAIAGVGIGNALPAVGNVIALANAVPQVPGWGTYYSSGLNAAQQLMMKAAGNPRVNKKKPLVIFLSDGENNGGQDPLHCVNQMKSQVPRMTLHSILYGNHNKSNILKKMAELGDGEFHHTLDGVQLARSFAHLAESLKTPVASLM